MAVGCLLLHSPNPPMTRYNDRRADFVRPDTERDAEEFAEY